MAHERESFGVHDGERLGVMTGEERSEYVEVPTRLRLRVTKNGARSWLVVYWSSVAKNTRRMTFGDAATMPLKEARAQARAALHAVEKEGRDPYAEKLASREQEREQRKARAAERIAARAASKRRRMTFGAICSAFIEHRRSTPGGRHGRTAAKRSLQAWESILRRYVAPTFGNLPPEAITEEDVTATLEASIKNGGPSMPRHVLAFLLAVWSWARTRQKKLGIVLPALSPLVGIEPIGATKRNRDRAPLSPAEIWRLWKATEGDREASSLRLMLLTGARVNEAMQLPVSELNFSANVWTLPASRNKGGRDHAIPLSKEALAVIQTAMQDGDPLVFGNRKSFEVMPRVHERMKELAEKDGGAFVDFQARDLRSTFGTLCQYLSISESVVSRLLGHSQKSGNLPTVSTVYMRHDYESEKRKAAEKLAAWVAATVKAQRAPKN
jgi:integrase